MGFEGGEECLVLKHSKPCGFTIEIHYVNSYRSQLVLKQVKSFFLLRNAYNILIL